jgi:hypothetical protein
LFCHGIGTVPAVLYYRDEYCAIFFSSYPRRNLTSIFFNYQAYRLLVPLEARNADFVSSGVDFNVDFMRELHGRLGEQLGAGAFGQVYKVRAGSRRVDIHHSELLCLPALHYFRAVEKFRPLPPIMHRNSVLVTSA